MQDTYKVSLTEHIFGFLSQQKASLCEIVRNCQGAYPVDILDALNYLSAESQIVFDSGLYYRRDFQSLIGTVRWSDDSVNFADSKLKEIESLTSVLSSPHPADYDWRFTSETIHDLSTYLTSRFSLEISIGLFGVTTMYPVLKKVFGFKRVDLYNQSESLISDLQKSGYEDGLFAHNLFDRIDVIDSYDLIIADPPWYLDYYSAFIERASEAVRFQGYLILSVLPRLTRPDAEDDIFEIRRVCELNGFVEVGKKDGFLQYESPAFEKLSLSQSGLHCDNWRRGDMVIYKKINKSAPRPISTYCFQEPIWEEFVLDGTKIKIRQDYGDNSEFSYEYADLTPVLSSVSRRATVRDRINFWTSDNYAFKVKRVEVLGLLFRFINTGQSFEQALKHVESITDLHKAELAELYKFLRVAKIYDSKQTS